MLLLFLPELILKEKTLFIMSSDFIHFGRLFGFVKKIDQDQELNKQVELYDQHTWSFIENFDYSGFRTFFESIKGKICGCYGINVLLRILEDKSRAEKYFRSELSTIKKISDFSISYQAIGFYDSKSDSNNTE